MSSLKWDMSQTSKMFIARETINKSWQNQILRHQIVQDPKLLKSDTLFQFAQILPPEYCTDEAMDPTFPMNYVQAFQHDCSQKN